MMCSCQLLKRFPTIPSIKRSLHNIVAYNNRRSFSTTLSNRFSLEKKCQVVVGNKLFHRSIATNNNNNNNNSNNNNNNFHVAGPLSHNYNGFSPVRCTVGSRWLSTGPLSVGEEVDQLIRDNKVTIFSKSYCPFCHLVKGIFDRLNVPYVAHELDLVDNGAAIQANLLERSGQNTVPNVYINGEHLGGASDTRAAFDDGRLHEMLGEDLTHYDYDLFVIGGGSGGLACSKEAAKHGVKVAVADFVSPTPVGTTWGIGGTCVNVGCIPKKLMHQAALLGEARRDAAEYGWNESESSSHDWSKMVGAIQDHIRGLNWGYKVQLRDESVKYYNKHATLMDKHTLTLRDKKGKEETVTARNIVLAMGGRPTYPDVPGIKENSITSDDLFSLPHAPGKTLVCGASYIALECAGFLHGLGYDVTVMVRSIFLRGFDQEMATKVGDYMEETGVKFLKNFNIMQLEEIESGASGRIRATFQDAEGVEVSEEYNTVLVATGRTPLTDGVGLDTAGVQINPKNGFVITDDSDRTNVDNLYAIGDLADAKPELTPVAIQAGKLLARRLFAGGAEKCDYTNVATTIFTPLEYGTCGLSEEDAIALYGEDNIEVFHSNFTPLEATVPHRLDNACFGKIVCDLSNDNKVVGIHVMGPNAGEVIQGFAMALKLGARKSDFDELIGIHPTNAEVFTTMNITKRSGGDPSVTGC